MFCVRIASTLANCFKIPELEFPDYRSRIGILAVCRLLAVMSPIPGLNGAALVGIFLKPSKSAGTGWVGWGMLQHSSRAVRMNIAPSVRWASCLTSAPPSSFSCSRAVIPRVEQAGRAKKAAARKIIQYGRYLTVLLCIGQGAYL
jgi:hypothetical protein